jgi:hypothetical protein
VQQARIPQKTRQISARGRWHAGCNPGCSKAADSRRAMLLTTPRPIRYDNVNQRRERSDNIMTKTNETISACVTLTSDELESVVGGCYRHYSEYPYRSEGWGGERGDSRRGERGGSRGSRGGDRVNANSEQTLVLNLNLDIDQINAANF